MVQRSSGNLLNFSMSVSMRLVRRLLKKRVVHFVNHVVYRGVRNFFLLNRMSCISMLMRFVRTIL